ncbi:MAG: translation initiation factor IF-2 [Spirochaetia bacterium]|nr:translation initiation factor IF-2 [Spirochaetia bacterium]
MSEEFKKKKKLIIKKTGGGETIAEKINRQKREKEAEIKKNAKIQAAPAVIQKNNTPDTGIFPPVAPTVIEENKDAVVPETSQAKAAREKEKSDRNKYQFREDILKNEEHKKFFMKQQTHGKGSTGPTEGVLSSSVPKEIKITEYIQVGELARKLNIKTSNIIAKLMHMGVMATITQSIDAETATLVAAEYGCRVQLVSLYEETLIEEEVDKEDELQPRPPVVTVMGHVDHGKTRLLDALRKTDIVSQEAGGITQHIGAYQVQTARGKITFLDTPGHAAFTAMRARGAHVTDIVILVVAADDGVMPQTIEAIKHAQDANVPIIVAVNKIDLPSANPERILQQLTQYQLVPEEWGGTTPVVHISALKGTNLDKLEDVILTTAEMLQLKANPNKKAVGTVIEAMLDQGRGPVATILISNGTLKQTNSFIVGMESGRIRAMFNDRGQKITEAGPATPVVILGLNGVPNAGDPFHEMDSEKEAKVIMEKRQDLNRQQQAQKIKKVKLENLNQMIIDGNVNALKIIIKADVRGSVEAIQESLEKLSIPDVRVQVIFGATGEISESDVMLASAGKAMIIAFNTKANARVREIADREGVEIKHYNIIYQVIDDIKSALTGMLAPEITQVVTGDMEVRECYKISALGTVAGCMVKSGFIKRNSKVRVTRKGVEVFHGGIKSLKRFKDDVNEVKDGFECGIMLEGFNDMEPGDIIEAYESQSKERTHEDAVQKEKQDKKAAASSSTDVE